MQLILLQKVTNLGNLGDKVNVKPGYARNFLLPRDLAVEPTPGSVKKIEERRKEIERQYNEQMKRLKGQAPATAKNGVCEQLYSSAPSQMAWHAASSAGMIRRSISARSMPTICSMRLALR